jgi:hypothetical protein
MSIKITIPNTSSDVLTFGSANTPTAAQIAGIDSGSSNGQLALYTTASGTSTERVRVDASGNVGIGTSSPSSFTAENESKLTVGTGSGNGGITVYTGNTSQGGIFFADGTSGTATYSGILRYNHSDNAMLFYTNGLNERARIDSSGNLLVGTTSTISIAGVSADHALVGTTGNGRWATAVRNTGNSTPWGLAIQYSAAAPNNTSQNFLYCYDTVAEKCSIRSNGGVANYSANNVNLASDLRLKHDIEPVQSYWNVFKSIEWKTWLYNDQTDEIKNIGVIAQELQALAPELVCESNALPTPEGESPYLGLWENDFKMAGMSVITELVKRCEEQQALITQLQADVAALKGA